MPQKLKKKEAYLEPKLLNFKCCSYVPTKLPFDHLSIVELHQTIFETMVRHFIQK